MKFTVSRIEFAAALKTCAPATKKSTVLPITQCALIETDGEKLAIRATDLDVTITTSCAAAVDSDGGIAIELAPLLSLVKAMTSDELVVEVIGGRAKIAGGKSSSYSLSILPPQDFPVASGIEHADGEIEIGAAYFAKAIKSAQFAIGEDAMFAGVWVAPGPNGLTLYVTNGKRMLCERVVARGKVAEMFMVPAGAVRALASIFPEDGDMIARLIVGDNHLRIAFGDTAIMAVRTYVDSHPDFGSELVRRKASQWVNSVSRSALHAAFSRALMLRSDGDKIRSGILRVTVEPGIVKIQAEHADANALEIIAADCEVSMTSEIDGKYIADFLAECDAENVCIGFMEAGGGYWFNMRAAEEMRETYPDVEYLVAGVTK